MWLGLNREDFAYADLTENPWMPVGHLRDLAGREYYKVLVGEQAGWVEWTDYLEQAPVLKV